MKAWTRSLTQASASRWLAVLFILGFFVVLPCLGEEAEPPPWVPLLRARTVADYLPPVAELDAKEPLPSESLQRLFDDLLRLHQYFERSNPKAQNDGFVERDLYPFVTQMTWADVFTPPAGRRFTRARSEWSLETLLMLEEMNYAKRQMRWFHRGLDALVGIDLKKPTRIIGRVAVGAGAIYLAHHFGVLNGFVWFVIGATQIGPGAAIANAASGWFIRPVTEFINVMQSRYTGGVEQQINHFFDRFKPKNSPTDLENRNEMPRIANIEQDGMNFAEMSPEDQVANWNKNLRVWVGVAKRFGQLLRDTHHSGRHLMMMAWTDEQDATQMVEVMDSKLVALENQTRLVLQPYLTAHLLRGEVQEKDHLDELTGRYKDLCEEIWLAINLEPERLQALDTQLEDVQKEFTEAGISDRDINTLTLIQAHRAQAVGTLVTALAVLEIRSFATAEANRNLETEARQSQRAVRKGFGLQTHVERYLPLVQEQQRRMGYQNKGRKSWRPRSALVKFTDQCLRLLRAPRRST